MTEYSEAVEQQRLLLEVEKWAKGISCMHFHSLTSMHYDTAETKAELIKNGPVTDTTYNSGVIIRERNGKHVHTFGEELKGDALIDSYCRSSA